jgi:hypothetical protein
MAVNSIGNSATDWGGAVPIQLTLDARVGSDVLDIPTLAVLYGIGSITPTELASGANSVAIPFGAGSIKATMMMVIMPASTAQTVLVKEITGDTGNKLAQGMWGIWPINSANAAGAMILTASAAVAVRILFW